MPTNCVWVDNLADTVQENFLFRQFARYGPLSNMVIDRERGKALIFFNNLENAQFALNEMRNRILNGQKIQVCKNFVGIWCFLINSISMGWCIIFLLVFSVIAQIIFFNNIILYNFLLTRKKKYLVAKIIFPSSSIECFNISEKYFAINVGNSSFLKIFV